MSLNKTKLTLPVPFLVRIQHTCALLNTVLAIRITCESEIGIHKHASTLLIRVAKHQAFLSAYPLFVLSRYAFFEGCA